MSGKIVTSSAHRPIPNLFCKNTALVYLGNYNKGISSKNKNSNCKISYLNLKCGEGNHGMRKTSHNGTQKFGLILWPAEIKHPFSLKLKENHLSFDYTISIYLNY